MILLCRFKENPTRRRFHRGFLFFSRHVSMTCTYVKQFRQTPWCTISHMNWLMSNVIFFQDVASDRAINVWSTEVLKTFITVEGDLPRLRISHSNVCVNMGLIGSGKLVVISLCCSWYAFEHFFPIQEHNLRGKSLRKANKGFFSP